MKYSVLFIVSVLIAAALIAGCTQQAATQPSTTPQGTIKVGVIASLTGPASNVGTNMWQSAQVAADKINAGGGVTLKDGSKAQLRLIVGDDESTQQGGQKAATKLITDDKVDILVGGYSSAVTSAYEQTIAEYKVPYIVTGASSPIITHRTDIDTSLSSTIARQPTPMGSIPRCSSTRLFVPQSIKNSAHQQTARSGLPCCSRTLLSEKVYRLQ